MPIVEILTFNREMSSKDFKRIVKRLQERHCPTRWQRGKAAAKRMILKLARRFA